MLIEKRMLVVDDEEDMRNTLKRRLKKIGYSVEVAEDGDDALKKMRNNGPGVITLDIRMPKKDGIEALREIKQLYSDKKVIIYTVVQDKKTEREAKRLGAYDYIEKGGPFENLADSIGAAFFAQEEELIIKQFEKEEDVYLQKEEEFVKEYKDEFIAMLEGKIVAHGKDESKVFEEAHQKYGEDIPIYIRKVGEEIPTITI